MNRTQPADPRERLTGHAPAIRALRDQIHRLAVFDQVGGAMVPTVLIQGETGTGKGLVARLVHDLGPRAAGPFVPVNCAAIPETMLEAELFGFEAGAFTDARRAKPGLFEAASGGTLFLDEIDALTLPLQGKLLTAIEAKRVRRLGALAERAVDVKLLVATQADLGRAVGDGRFREDLYHRLAVLVLTLPPLRERGEDVVLLAETFARQLAAGYGVEPKTLTEDARRWLRDHPWPGNVRELRHVVERLTLLHPGREIGTDALIALARPPATGAEAARAAAARPDAPDEASAVREALRRAEGNVVRAARLLGVSRDAIRWRMRRLGIEHPRRAARPAPPGAAREPRRAADPRPGPDAPPAASGDARAMPGWERKTVAVLAIEATWAIESAWADGGSPEAGGGARPQFDAWTEAARWERSSTEKVRGVGGVRLQHTPSLDLWLFGVPHVLDQLAERALQAALALRQDVDALPADRRPQVRMALHLGAVVVDTQAEDATARVLPVGETLALPVRLLAGAAAGEILASPAIERRLAAWVTLEPRELEARPGAAPPLRGHLVRGLSRPRARRTGGGRRPLSPFVGRAQELTALRSLVAKAVTGAGQAVGVVGEPGSGKSRLLYELRQSLRGERVTYVETHCLAYASLTPYAPLTAVLRALCRVGETDPAPVVEAKLRRGIRRLGLGSRIETHDLLQLTGLAAMSEPTLPDPRVLRARTFETLRRILVDVSQRRPLVLAVENVHWIDPTSEAFFESVTEQLVNVPLMLLTTYRPGYRPPWLARSRATQIALQPLAEADSRQIVRAVTGRTPLAASTEGEVLARGEGNPFFLEELARALVEHGGGAPAIPSTIQAVLEARIDRLAPADKRLLQAAAVIGREVPLTWLVPLAGLDEEAVQASLARLQAAELLAEARRIPDRAYAFRHTLIQAVAYATLLPPQRRALHQAVLERAARVADDRRGDHVSLLAHHALHAEAWDRAVGYFHQAALAAWVRASHREAAHGWEQALGALGRLPADRDTLEREADVRFGMAHALYSGGELERAREQYGRAEAAAARLGDGQRLARIAAGLTYVLGSLGDHAGAVAAGERVMAHAAAPGDLALRSWTAVSLGREYFALGEYRRGIECTRLAVEALRHTPVGQRFQHGSLLPAVGTRTWLALCHGRRGEFEAAIGWGGEAVGIAEAADSPLDRAWASYALARVHLGRGDFGEARRLIEQALPLCEGGRFPLYLPRVLCSLGVAFAWTGRRDEALPILERAMGEARAIGLRYGYAMILTHLGDAYLDAGRLADARRVADEALQVTRAHGERGDEAWVLHLLGGIEAAEGARAPAGAGAAFHEALARAEALEMRPLEARCRLGLAAVAAGAGRPDTARVHLVRATALLGAAGMAFWLPAADAVRARLA